MDFGELSTYYEVMREISRGSYGVVYKSYLKDDEGKILKDKRLAIKAIYGTVSEIVVHNELCFLKLLGGKNNTVKLKDASFTNYQYFIITDYFKHHTIDVD